MNCFVLHSTAVYVQYIGWKCEARQFLNAIRSRGKDRHDCSKMGVVNIHNKLKVRLANTTLFWLRSVASAAAWVGRTVPSDGANGRAAAACASCAVGREG